MVTVDLFRLSRHDQIVGHVRILRQRSGAQFHAIISYRDCALALDDDTTSHRLQASSRKLAIEAVLSWADAKFGDSCRLLPLRQNFSLGMSMQRLAL